VSARLSIAGTSFAIFDELGVLAYRPGQASSVIIATSKIFFYTVIE
jgi:hypothetical protein